MIAPLGTHCLFLRLICVDLPVNILLADCWPLCSLAGVVFCLGTLVAAGTLTRLVTRCTQGSQALQEALVTCLQRGKHMLLHPCGVVMFLFYLQ
jgi:hypothetical protein